MVSGGFFFRRMWFYPSQMARNSTVLPAFNQVLPRIASDLRPSPDFFGMKHGRLGSCRVRPEHSETDTEQLLIGIPTPITPQQMHVIKHPNNKNKEPMEHHHVSVFFGMFARSSHQSDRQIATYRRSRQKKQDQVGDHRNSIYVI